MLGGMSSNETPKKGMQNSKTNKKKTENARKGQNLRREVEDLKAQEETWGRAEGSRRNLLDPDVALPVRETTETTPEDETKGHGLDQPRREGSGRPGESSSSEEEDDEECLDRSENDGGRHPYTPDQPIEGGDREEAEELK